MERDALQLFLNTLINVITSGMSQFTWQDALDIFIIFLLLYKLILWTRETRAYEVLKGIGILFVCSVISQLFELNTLSWVLNAFVKSGSIIIVLVVLFQPEIRRMLEHIGRSGKSVSGFILNPDAIDSDRVVSEITRAVLSMSRRRVGALIVVEQKTGLSDLMATGTVIDAYISGALIENIFEPNTPLHDGAVIIRDSRIHAAGCILPLSDDMNLARELGTRHRAAIGVSTVSDSVTIVVSEETGAISVAKDGKLVRYLDKKTLEGTLEPLFTKKTAVPLSLSKRREKNAKN